jgi:phage replication-related protein YjqB (UPF0714/DUF867 family)
MPPGKDLYIGMNHLYAHETEGVDYTKEWHRHRWRYKTSQDNKDENEIFVMAPHGGGIEVGTTELALATAGFTSNFNRHPATTDTYDYFIFNGKKPGDQNGSLHVTASNYDDFVANELVQNSVISLAFHGCTDEQAKPNTTEEYKACLIGGLDIAFMTMLEYQLYDAGFNALISDQEMLNGDLPDNIINKNKRRAGVQFELTNSFRQSLYDTFKTPLGRRTTTNDNFWLFVNTIRESIEDYKAQLSV